MSTTTPITKTVQDIIQRVVIGFISLYASSIIAQTTTTTPASSANDDSTIILDRYVSVGSRIRRLDNETVSPVTAIHSDDLERTGFTSIADAVRALPFNSGQALTPIDGGTSFTPGVNSFNLRGLGNNNTLVLINGRRAVPYAVPGFNGFQTVFDLNSIPDAAIDSVEILKDGGSALYGSDAVAGVVNFKLKKNYQGVFTSLEFGNYFSTDGAVKKAALIGGNSSGGNSIFFALSVRTQEAIYARDLSYSANADKTDIASGANLRYEFGSADAKAAWEDYYGIPISSDPASDLVDWGWFDNRSSTGFPGRVVVSGRTKTFAAPTSSPTVAGSVSGTNYYNFQDRANLIPSTRGGSFFTAFNHDFNPFVYLKSEVSFTRNESKSDAAPTPVVIASEHGLDSGSKMNIPSYNAYNPWGVNITSGSRRLVELGNRVNDVTSDTPRILVALGGKLPNYSFLEDWTWEVGTTYSKNQITNANHNSVTDYKMQQALNGLTDDGQGHLSWNPSTPNASRVYFNWFGLNGPGFVKFLSSDNPTSAALEYESGDFQATGTLFHLPAGPVGVAIGGEHRAEKLSVTVSDLNESGNIIGGAQNSSSYGSRQVNSIYGEANIPVFKWLELMAAGRFEQYSDKDFKEEIHPKLGFKLSPFDWLILRASYSESFKAPDLAFLYSGGTTTFTSAAYVDPVTSAKSQIQVHTSGDPTLKPEKTNTTYMGFAIEPRRGWLNGFSVSVDYFKMSQKHLLAQLTDFYSYGDFLNFAASGVPMFASRVVRDPSTSQLLYISDNYSNLGNAEYKGFDFDVAYVFKTPIGRFRTSASGTYIHSYSLNDSDLAGTSLTARFNGNAGLTWSYRHLALNLFAVYRGVRHGMVDFGNVDGTTDTELYIHYDIKPQTTINSSVSYDALWGTKVTLGVDNLFNKKPPVDPQDQTGTTAGLNAIEPSFWYVRLEKQF